MTHVTCADLPDVFQYRRHQLIPRKPGPWLRPKSPTWSALGITCGIVTLLSVGLMPLRAWVLPGILLANALVLLAFVLAALYRAEIQVCPCCLQNMALGATRCHCGFDDGSLP
jgi:hypothetical protein